MTEKKEDTLTRVERQFITDKETIKLFDDLCYKSKNIYNYANYYFRQVFILYGKDEKEWTEQDKEMVKYIKEKVNEYNERNNKKSDKIMDYPSKENRYLGRFFVDWMIKNETREDNPYRQLPAATAQNVITLLDKNWKSFFELVKTYRKDPSSLNGRPPQLPKYKHKEKGRNIVIFSGGNQVNENNGYIQLPNKINYKIKTHVRGKINQVRIIPRNGYYVIEVVYPYKPEDGNKLKTPSMKRCIGIDIGINNLMSIANNIELPPVIINGRHIKSINKYYNKLKSKAMSYIGKCGTSKRTQRIDRKRIGIMSNKMHEASRWVISYCIENNIDTIIIGRNKGWKQKSDMGKRNNQTFVQIPFYDLIKKITYKAEEYGIKVIEVEESYTSKSDALALEDIKFHNSFLGERIGRGGFQSSTGKFINADINGALNILRKKIGDKFIKEIVNNKVDITPKIVTL